MGTVKSLKFFTFIGSFRQNYISSKSTLKSCFGKKKKKKIQKGYLSQHRRVMQILNKNWLIVSNMTEIRWIFTQQFKSLKMDFLFDGFFRSLSYKKT